MTARLSGSAAGREVGRQSGRSRDGQRARFLSLLHDMDKRKQLPAEISLWRSAWHRDALRPVCRSVPKAGCTARDHYYPKLRVLMGLFAETLDMSRPR